jgi:predicted Fe-Mo cluster-binding NifX family protein
MKIAVTSEGEELQSKVDQRFGRSLNFLIFEIEGEKIQEFTVVKNEGAIQGHGAGIRAAEQIGKLNVDIVITGQLGPNATNVLKKMNIKAYSGSGIISEAINNFIENKLEEITEISESHSSVDNTKETDERIFFPLLNDNGLESEISQHFGHAPFFGLYNVNKEDLTIIPNDLDHSNPNMSPIDQIQEAVQPTTIFAKSIGGRAIGLIQEKGLSLKTGNFNKVKEVIENLDNLDEQTQSCGHTH